MAGKIFTHLVHQPVAKAAYHPEIDGLRAIAVLAVIMFHYEAAWMPGGFVGVDVFFVISGYLITRLIRNGVATGEFTFFNFYVRRARRLFPALFFTLACTFLAAVWLFSPDHLERLGGSTLYSLLSLSNFFFWFESGYFDASATVKPLLHFWSLGVEEQFYLLWPVTLVFLLTWLRNPIALLAFIVLTGLASLALSQHFINVDPAGAFYLLPFRVFEFAVGAMLVWIPRERFPGGAMADVLLAIGLALILYAAITYSRQTPFPGLNALVPCLGTALAMVSGASPRVGILLRNRLMIFIGLISYSLYLCHWPIYTLYRYQVTDWEWSASALLGLTATSVIVATLMYRFVEVPFRFITPERKTAAQSARFALACALLSLAVVIPTAHSWATGGWAWRFGGASSDISAVFDLDRFRHESILFHEVNLGGATFQFPGKIKVLVVGDSHARDVGNGLFQALKSDTFEVRAQEMDARCLELLDHQVQPSREHAPSTPASCSQMIQSYEKSYKVRTADIYVISMFFTPKTAAMVDRLIRLTKQRAVKPNVGFLIMDRTVSFSEFHPKAIRMISAGDGLDTVNRSSHRFAQKPPMGLVTRTLREAIEPFSDVEVVVKRQLICDEQNCSFFLDGGQLAFWDATHWTVLGAGEFMQRLVERRPALFQ